jgi:hypothetical protein
VRKGGGGREVIGDLISYVESKSINAGVKNMFSSHLGALPLLFRYSSSPYCA